MYFSSAFIASLLAASTAVSAVPLERRKADVKMMGQTLLDAAGAAYCEYADLFLRVDDSLTYLTRSHDERGRPEQDHCRQHQL